jgi:TalC/MipB family fructose-6-phosphate aldolase
MNINKWKNTPESIYPEEEMELWLAFTSFEEMKKAHEFPIKGVLTNPTLVSLSKIPYREAISRMNMIGDLPLGLQVVSTDEKSMIEEIKIFHELVDRKMLIVKLPFCLGAIKVVPFIRKFGHTVNMAAICTYSQALVALETDIEYLSIYVGRVNDGGGDGIDLVSRVKQYASSCGLRAIIQAASIRTVRQLEDVALAGADAAVLPYAVLEEAIKSELTDQSLKKFAKDWDTIQ